MAATATSENTLFINDETQQHGITFASDVANAFAFVPALFLVAILALGALTSLGLKMLQSAMLSAVLFNTLLILALVPLNFKVLAYMPFGALLLCYSNYPVLAWATQPAQPSKVHVQLNLALDAPST